MSSTTSHQAGTIQQPLEEIVELHWMKEPDIAMHQRHGLAVPALCGEWMEPDEDFAADLTSGQVTQVRYVSCRRCDHLHARNQAVPDSRAG